MRLKLCCAALAAMFILVAAGCGSDSGSKTSASSEQTTATTTTTPARAALFVNRYPKPRSPGAHPGARVETLIVKDVHTGSGAEIHAGDRGVFEFIAENYDTGRIMESSWHRRRPFETTIEHGVVIDGWWQGIPGMRVGGERRITIPPALGFTNSLVRGLRGATTYFDVVLVGVIPQTPRGVGGGAAAGGGTTRG